MICRPSSLEGICRAETQDLLSSSKQSIPVLASAVKFCRSGSDQGFPCVASDARLRGLPNGLQLVGDSVTSRTLCYSQCGRPLIQQVNSRVASCGELFVNAQAAAFDMHLFADWNLKPEALSRWATARWRNGCKLLKPQAQPPGMIQVFFLCDD